MAAMANKKHLAILKQGVEIWNKWRREQSIFITPGLARADLMGADLRLADLTKADLTKADLIGAYLIKADLTKAHLMLAHLNSADLTEADLTEADLSGAYLSGAHLGRAQLMRADLRKANLMLAHLMRADLRGADFSGADLRGADFSGADISDADLTYSRMGYTILVGVNLSRVKGLETVNHISPSSVDIDTIYKSKGEIPEEFLRGAGVPDSFITYMSSLTGEALQYYSCFISYSTKDQAFTERLHADLQAKGVRCWFAPEDIKGGRKLHEQIPEAIRLYDKLLLVLSENSINSEWVKTEIYHARQDEIRNNKRKLFPIGLVAFDTIRHWEAFDADVGKDMAREVREYFVPDFSNWKDHDAYKKAFDRLLRDLKASEMEGSSRNE